MTEQDPRLTEDRLNEARATLTAAFVLALRGEINGAGDVVDLPGVLVEAKRNLTAIVGELHGEEAWNRALDD